MSEELYSEEFGSDENPVLICLHGLLGSSRNWRSVARIMAENFHVFGIDLRNHGKSFHSDETNVDVMSRDILEWMEKKSIPECFLCGHSLGGKVAMRLACDRESLVKGLIVVDIAPRDYPKEHHLPTLDALLELKLKTLLSRKEADQLLELSIPNWAFRQFLLTNLNFDQRGAFWNVNLRSLRDSMVALSSNPLGKGDFFKKPSLFVRGGRSGYVRMEHYEEILNYFPNAQIETIDDAGHDVHVESRSVFVEKISAFLDKCLIN